MSLLKGITVALILLFPIGELGRINIYKEISTTVNDILIFAVFFIWLLSLILKKKLSEITKRRLAKPILYFALIAFISLVFNINKLNFYEFTASSLYLLRFISYAGIYFVIAGFDHEFRRKILSLMIVSGLLVVLAGFLQYFLYPDLRNLYYLGWDEHLYRLFSSFLDPNFSASVISLFLILLLSMVVSKPGLSVYYKLGLYTLSAFSFISLLLTYSRSGYLMFVVSISTLFIILGKKRHIVFLFAVFVLGLIFLPKNFGGEGVNLLRTASITARSQYMENAITIFKDNPVFGVGFNAYRYAQYRYGFIDKESLETNHAGAGADNSFLFVLATTGIVGFVFYLYMWYSVLKNAFQKDLLSRHSGERSPAPDGVGRNASRISQSDGRFRPCQNDDLRFRNLISAIAIASSAGLFVNAFFINSLFYPFIMEWMWILLALKENR